MQQKFRNPTDKTITMQFGTDAPIVIAPGAEAPVPARWVPLVKDRGYRVEKVAAPATSVAPGDAARARHAERETAELVTAVSLETTEALLASIDSASELGSLEALATDFQANVAAGKLTHSDALKVRARATAKHKELTEAQRAALLAITEANDAKARAEAEAAAAATSTTEAPPATQPGADAVASTEPAVAPAGASETATPPVEGHTPPKPPTATPAAPTTSSKRGR